MLQLPDLSTLDINVIAHGYEDARAAKWTPRPRRVRGVTGHGSNDPAGFFVNQISATRGRSVRGGTDD